MAIIKEDNMRETYCESCGDRRLGAVTFDDRHYPHIKNDFCKKCGKQSLRLKSEIDDMVRELSEYEVYLEVAEEDRKKEMEQGMAYQKYGSVK